MQAHRAHAAAQAHATTHTHPTPAGHVHHSPDHKVSHAATKPDSAAVVMSAEANSAAYAASDGAQAIPMAWTSPYQNTTAYQSADYQPVFQHKAGVDY